HTGIERARVTQTLSSAGYWSQRPRLMSKPDVSLIVISLNSRQYIAGCMDSIKSAEWREVKHETIIVDNGSTDGRLELLANRHPEATGIANGANLGIARRAMLVWLWPRDARCAVP